MSFYWDEVDGKMAVNVGLLTYLRHNSAFFQASSIQDKFNREHEMIGVLRP